MNPYMRFSGGNQSAIDLFRSMNMPSGQPMGGYGQMGAVMGGLPLALKGLSAFGPGNMAASQAERPMMVGQGLGGAVSGAMSGAAIGSVVPGVGTAVGAVGGAMLGALPAIRRLFGKTPSRRSRI